ncbi:glycoside hydrolase family 15 protein [Nocardioides mesophilus]|uniref:Trehalase n=1 Tax=Nocardioides mesophilus TaxID=433659 RepID=A0A7G9R8H5_9ACTN|nr:glycoside hydrolase family 15 protein [Nocardioides mesophilus]QNN51900.1 glycoside hydrolase family 15 protein [Nocardioides mesophilus]
MRIEDYALIGDTQTAALVGKNGSIDWLCLPRFDSGACFAALLGEPDNGRWLLAPADEVRDVQRRYRPGTLVLETEFTTEHGTVRVVDCMPIREGEPNLVRRVEGVSGRVRMRSELVVRLDYGHIVPWLRRDGRRVQAFAGPDTLTLDTDADIDGEDQGDPTCEFEVGPGEAVDFRLAWTRPREAAPEHLDVGATIERTTQEWEEWASRCTYHGPHRELVRRSLIVLKALTYRPTGGIVAAPTTSLPEQVGGVRNWDYRYCWIRDATFTLLALIDGGYTEEAEEWREWLLRALAGRPDQMQIMYGVEGERRLTEIELDWLSGYEDSRPVRAGNAASGQFQLDVYGELMDALHQARTHGVPPDEHAWEVQRSLVEFLEAHWHEPDNGIWEIRGGPRHFTFSKVMAWAAMDRAVKAVEQFGLEGPVDRWREVRQQIFDEVCEKGYDAGRNTFTQYYGSQALDASLLLISEVGFLPPDDPRMLGTVETIEKELCPDGFVARYSMTEDSQELDGLPPGEGSFLACTFWLADCYLAQGRRKDAEELFERLVALTNDVGLLSEEYDAKEDRLVGNFPQALSHIALVNTALNLETGTGPSKSRRHTGEEGRPTR